MSDETRHDAHAAEVRHRTANTLQLISALARMRGQRAGDPETRRQLVWMADAVGALGALERHRCEGGVDFRAYLHEMAPVWSRRRGVQSAEVVLSVETLIAPDQTASTLALIVHELTSNALAHAYDDAGGVLRVSLAPAGERRYELIVKDDGKGFDPSTCRERFGLWFVRSLAAQVRGEFELSSQPSVTARLLFAA
ncbi:MULTISPECIES: sensor histidine kinase [Phenylobacterium]|uniref:histidine kinase n=1 Tax=Phenylobacterium koreense TaxID=266125 RepID=A0ABV2EFP4_9CAUL